MSKSLSSLSVLCKLHDAMFTHTFRGVNGVQELLTLGGHGDEVHERAGCIGIPAIACQSLPRKLLDVLQLAASFEPNLIRHAQARTWSKRVVLNLL